MGIVYRARQVSLNRIVALKVLGGALTRPSDIVRFQREAQAAARLNHPNIATVHFVGQDDQHCYMAIEYVEGPSLARIIRCLATAGDPKLHLDSIGRTIEQAEPRAPTMRFDRATETLTSGDAAESHEYDLERITPEAEQLAQSASHIRRCCELVRDAAHALAHAHDKSVVHRDIKPENLLLDGEGQVHVIDFGIARFFEDATITQTGRLVGTPMYMSPEQVTARLEVDHRTDIYSLGLVLYELLTLRPAMLAPTREGVLRNIVTKALPPVSSKNPGVSQDLEGVVHKATARDPDERYQTAEELAADLERWIEGKPVSAKPYRYEADLTEIEATRPHGVLLLSVILAGVSLLFVLYGITSLSLIKNSDPLHGLSFFSIASGTVILGWGVLRGYSWVRWSGSGAASAIGVILMYKLVALVRDRPDGYYMLQFLFSLPLLLSIAVVVIPWRRKTRDWLLRARRVRGEYMHGNRAFLGAIAGMLTVLGTVGIVRPLTQLQPRRVKVVVRDTPEVVEGLLAQEEYVEAETRSRLALYGEQVLLPEGDSRIARLTSLLGASLAGQGKFEQAKVWLLDGYSQMKDNPEVAEERIQEALQRIIELYEAWGKPHKADKYRAILTHDSDAGEATPP